MLETSSKIAVNDSSEILSNVNKLVPKMAENDQLLRARYRTTWQVRVF
jgi:hypothetical protein